MENLAILFCLLSFGVILSAKEIPKGYSVTSVGCFVDSANDKDLIFMDHGAYIGSITIELCQEECLQLSKNDTQTLYFGLEFERMCYCGGEESNYSRYGVSDGCTIPCKGNKTQICGGHQAISVYRIHYSSSPCGQILPPTNGFVNLTDDKTATISCRHGYQLRGSQFVYCNLSSYEWDVPEEPSCRKMMLGKCMKLENPLYGKVHQDAKQANFSCDQSYILDGEDVLYCLHRGNWSAKPPTCAPEQYLTTMFGTEFDTTTDTNIEVLGLPIHIFTSLLLVAAAVLVVIIIILINLIFKTTTETKRIQRFKTDSTCVEQRSQAQGNNESYWKSHPDLLKTGKSSEAQIY